MRAFQIAAFLIAASACLTFVGPADAQITAGVGTGTFDFTVLPFGSQVTFGPAAIPRTPGFLDFTVSGIRGSSGYMPVSWDFNGLQAYPFLANTLTTPFLNQDSEAPSAAGALDAVLTLTYTLTFTIGAGGLPAQSITSIYSIAGLEGSSGGPGGFCSFTLHATYTHSSLGGLGTMDVFFARLGSGPFSSVTSGGIDLPAMPGPGTLTVSDYFEFRVHDFVGDHVVTEMGVRTIPEPGAMLLGGAAASIAAYWGWRRKRNARLTESLCLGESAAD